jgi:EmrB/QacA subfamily drug resistance transporter
MSNTVIDNPGSRNVVVWTVVLAALGTFVPTMDIVVVSTALPTLRTHLNASIGDLEWMINSYNLVFAVFMLTGAALGDRFGRKRMFAIGAAIFTLSSMAAALSGTSAELITFRAFQGVGAAILLPLTITLVADIVPVDKRAMVIGILGGVTGLGVAAGPGLGGLIVEGISWQWIFWINVPVGAFVTIFAALRLRESKGPHSYLDIPGLLLAGGAMFCLVWGAVRAPTVGWGATEVVGTLVGGAVLAVVFVVWETRASHPMFPVSYFRNRGFTGANIASYFMQLVIIGSLFMITQLFQIGMDYSPEQAGVRILAWMAMPMFFAPIGGILAGKVGNRPVLLVGLTMMAGGMAWLAAATTDTVTYTDLIAPLILAGIGIAVCFPVVMNAVTDAVPFEEIGIATGGNKTIIELGSVSGVAILVAVFTAHGSYASHDAFIAGFRPAMFTAAALAAAGLIGAAIVPGKQPRAAVSGEPLAAQTRQPTAEEAAT